MQYDVKTPQEYLQALEDDWRKQKLLKVREIIQEVEPDLQECIRYKMLGYEDKNGLIFCLNAQKNYVGVYFGDIKKVDPEGVLLKGLNLGKGCIRIKKSNEIARTGLKDFIAKAIAMWKRGEDIDC